MLAVVVDDHDMGVTHVIRGDDHLNNAFRQLAIIRAHGLARAGLRPRAADPRRRTAPSCRKRHGALGVDSYRDELGYPARGGVQLSAPARLGPWRRRDHQPRAGDRMVRPRPCRQVAVALRLQEAREPQRPLHPRGRRRAAGRAGRAACSGRTPTADLLVRAMPELKARAQTLHQLAEGARFLFAKRPLDIDERRRGAAHRRGARAAPLGASRRLPRSPNGTMKRSKPLSARWPRRRA